MKSVKLPASYYQQFDADYTRDVPAEGYGGWKSAEIELSPKHTAHRRAGKALPKRHC